MTKRIILSLVVCAGLVWWSIPGYCQYESASEGGVERSEDEVSQDLGSEIGGDQSQADSGVDQVESSMDSGRPAD